MITKEDKIADVLNRFPNIKEKFIKRNKLFKNLNNPVVFNTVGKFARISDIAEVSGEELEDLLIFINQLIADRK
ncbi:MAG: DUF1858 domain-containing protein [Planctomycetia bacterium]|nr:DUF1858 domain-containing protein [Planctomycetia bacterium]